MIDISQFEAMVKLDLPEDERRSVAERAEKLLQGFSRIESIDTEGVEPLITVLGTHSILRDDTARKSITRDELLSNAPEQYDGYFQVPKTIE
jgi:aspartyl-tRNA(Asn)/glutamyl-tRNA(Gln) amidotransferase subunit C